MDSEVGASTDVGISGTHDTQLTQHTQLTQPPDLNSQETGVVNETGDVGNETLTQPPSPSILRESSQPQNKKLNRATRTRKVPATVMAHKL